MLNPGPRLRGLIQQATPAQHARACAKARIHRALCVREEVEPANAETFLIEALEIEMREPEAEEADAETEVRRRLELYTGRDYSGSYTER